MRREDAKMPVNEKKTQCYIGSPCGVVLCITRRKNERTEGRFYHAYQKEPVVFDTMEQAVLNMERFFDRLGIPFPGTEERSFNEEKQKQKKEKMVKVMGDEELLKKHGESGTFIVRVQHRQHSSWQGRVTWVEEDKTVSFRSVLELIKLIDSAVDDEDDEQGTFTTQE